MFTDRLVAMSAIAALVGGILGFACSGHTHPNECSAAARDAGVPEAVVGWMESPPSELGAVERVAVREALEQYALGDACTVEADSFVTAAAEEQPTSPTASPADAANEAPVASSYIPPQIPFPTVAPQREVPTGEQAEHQSRLRTLGSFDGSWQLRNQAKAVYTAVADLPWVADGIYRSEWDAVQGLIDLGIVAQPEAHALLAMAWLSDGLDDNEADAVSAMGYLAWNYNASASASPIAGILATPWFVDGISEEEALALYALPVIGDESLQTVTGLVSKPWFADGIDEDESVAVQALGAISFEAGLSSRFVVMPFLDTIEPPDSHALLSLSFIAEVAPGDFQEIVAHPTVADGVTDSEAAVLALLYDVQFSNPGLVETLLSPDGAQVEQHDIDLPLAGRVGLTIVRTQEGSEKSMALLEDVVRFSEEFMGEPFPTNFVLLLFADSHMTEWAGHHTGINVTIRPEFDVDGGSEDSLEAIDVFSHEVAHYYWGGYVSEVWVDEGAAELMALVYDEVNRGVEWYVSDIGDMYPCSLADLTALERLPEDARDEDCIYGLGAGLFLDLYRTLGVEDFRRGFRELYLLSKEDPGPNGPGARRTHVREAYGFHPEAREEIIPKWFGDQR